jgi:hypothetical protein
MGPRGLSSQPCQHDTEDSAFKEAHRLSTFNEGAFFVLEAKGASKRISVQIERFDDSDEIPF